MPKLDSTETTSLIREARDRAGKNRWVEAAKFCRQALNDRDSFPEDWNLASETEFSAQCHFKGAFQAKNREEFEELMTCSKITSDRARTLYDSAQQIAPSKRAQTRVHVAEFWLQRDAHERMILAGPIVSLFKESMKALCLS